MRDTRNIEGGIRDENSLVGSGLACVADSQKSAQRLPKACSDIPQVCRDICIRF